MNEKQNYEFDHIVQQCASDQFRSINVASGVRRDAIIAAWRELERLQDVNNDLLRACEAVMREDGHYSECPCRGNYSHADIMPHSHMTRVCMQLQAAIAKESKKCQ